MLFILKINFPILIKKEYDMSSRKSKLIIIIYLSFFPPACEDTSVIISTNCEEATTINEITKEAIALRFFLVYLVPSISSVPNTFVFSNIAKTIVKIRRKGKITS